MPQFKVIRASAGSGKTFNLTGEYLRVLFAESDAFMHILAVTFTNKATEEMKSRILNELFVLSSGQPSSQLNGLINASGLNEYQIRSKALVILKKLLHRYSSFSVTTIDSFFQRIIRNFTRELGIQEGYAIELDTELVLTEIIDNLLNKASQDKSLLSWLTQFAESLIDKGESWNIRKGIFDLGKEIFREEFKSLNEASMKRFADRNFLNEYRRTLYALMSQIEKTYREFGYKAMAIIQENGLSVDDFAYGCEGPAGFFKKLSDGVFQKAQTRAMEASTCAEKWSTKSSPLRGKIQALASSHLIPIILKANEYYDIHSASFFTSQSILKNLYALGILIDLSDLADSWCADNNTFLLPEAPVFLNRIIDGNDTPFIYEKAGCWYRHFMIDEFQDTSILQWLNFKPLISNSLSQNYDNLAVGDTKQSIYRWRNSNWDILESRVHNDFSPGIIHDVTLNENWRSKIEIIQFNNDFFKAAAKLLQEAFETTISKCRDGMIENLPLITDLYSAVEQHPGNPDNSGGYVRIEYVTEQEDNGYNNAINQKVVKLLNDLLDLGYHLNDIAILTRKNSEAASLADFILENPGNGNRRIDVISDEALHLGSSIVVNTIVALLHYISNPSDKTNNFYLASVCSNYIFGEADKEWINAVMSEKKPVLQLPEQFHELVSTGKSYSLIELTERIIKIFNLEKHTGESVYLMAFRDMIIDFSKLSGSDIPGFLDFWTESGNERSVSAPAGQDAVRILTLHKSKGLEFKITIIPYCNWELNTYNKSFLWCRPNEEPFAGLPLLPLNFTSTLEKTIFSTDYFKEIQKQYIDNLNLLYVSFTRAQEAMFIFCRAGEKDQVRTVSDLSRKILGNGLYEKGNLVPCLENHNDFSPSDPLHQTGYFSDDTFSNITGRIKIAFQGELIVDPAVNKPSRPLNEGKILHDLFKSIRKRNDIPDAIKSMYLQGKIALDEQEKYRTLINHAMNDIQVASWFTNDWNILNEAEIILPGGVIKRPDRVVYNSKQTLVIDYKFGNKTEASYQTQLKEYALLLKDMGYSNVEAYLWYVKLGKIVSVS